MARAAGTARFAYNWALAEWQRQYEEETSSILAIEALETSRESTAPTP